MSDCVIHCFLVVEDKFFDLKAIHLSGGKGFIELESTVDIVAGELSEEAQELLKQLVQELGKKI